MNSVLKGVLSRGGADLLQLAMGIAGSVFSVTIFLMPMLAFAQGHAIELRLGACRLQECFHRHPEGHVERRAQTFDAIRDAAGLAEALQPRTFER